MPKQNDIEEAPFIHGARLSTLQPGALKSKETCEYLRISTPTLHRLIKRGLLRPNRATRHLLFPIAELDRFLRDGQ
jgi:excisionase family DNA binding protein